MADEHLTTEQIESIRTSINLNVQSILEYQTRLHEDSQNPKRSYSLDGERVTRNEWRKGIADMLRDLVALNMELRKLIGETVQIEWLGKVPSEQIDIWDRD